MTYDCPVQVTCIFWSICDFSITYCSIRVYWSFQEGVHVTSVSHVINYCAVSLYLAALNGVLAAVNLTKLGFQNSTGCTVFYYKSQI